MVRCAEDMRLTPQVVAKHIRPFTSLELFVAMLPTESLKYLLMSAVVLLRRRVGANSEDRYSRSTSSLLRRAMTWDSVALEMLLASFSQALVA